MLKRLYHWMISAARSPRASWWLGFISFIESSVFPIAPDVMLIPMCLARPKKGWLYASIATAASVAGGAAGYAIGYFFFDAVGKPLLEFYGMTQTFDDFAVQYNQYGLWLVFIAGVTPLPFKVFTIASGLTHLNFPLFVLASIPARALRFFLEAALLWKFGDRMRDFIEKRMGLILSVGIALLIGGFALLKYVF